MSTLETVATDSSPDAGSASAAPPPPQTPPPQPATEHPPTGDDPRSPSGPSQRHDEQQPGQPSPAPIPAQAAGQQAVQARSRRLPSWLERNGIAAAVITSFAALLVYGFMSLSNQIDALGSRIDRVEDNLNQRITSVEHNLNQRIDRVDQRITDLEHSLNQRIDRVEQRLTDINATLLDHTGRLSRIETTLELGSNSTPET